jgi:hypothetical protein
LLDELWVGKESYECDGRDTDFSMLSFLASAKIKSLPGKKIQMEDLLGNNFKVFIEEENFWYQYKFRSKSIGFIFSKELFSNILMLVILIAINVQYLTNFNIQNFTELQSKITQLEKLVNDTEVR